MKKRTRIILISGLACLVAIGAVYLGTLASTSEDSPNEDASDHSPVAQSTSSIDAPSESEAEDVVVTEEEIPATLTLAEVKAEYIEVVHKYNADLPEGVSLSETYTQLGDPAALYSEGTGESQAVFEWLCAWEIEAIRAHGVNDSGAFDAAIDRVAQYQELDWTQAHVSDPENHWYNTVLKPATQGDVSGLKVDAAVCNSN